MTWVAHLGRDIYGRLAGHLEGCTAQLLRTWCVHAGNVSAGYIHNKVLSMVQEYPGRLLDGDLEANLDVLRDGPEPADSCTWKIQQLARIGYSRVKLLEGVRLLADVQWTTTSVE